MQIYVSNLGQQITEESLRALFATHGEVLSSRIMPGNRDEREGFALVEMPEQDHGARAIARIDGSVVNGRIIKVWEALP